MTTTGPGFLAERRQQLSSLPPLRNTLLALAVTERAVREAESLTGKDRSAFPPTGPALDLLWTRLGAGDTAMDAVLKDYHKAVADYLPQEEDDPKPPPAWNSALSALALTFMSLVKPDESAKFAGSACAEGAHMVTMYYVDMDAAFAAEVAWQDRALDLTRKTQPGRDEYLAVPDYPRGPWQEPD